MGFKQLFWRACRLRCPECGRGRLFRNLLKMRDVCEECEFRFEREPGFFLGSIYFNYGLTGIIVAIAYPILLFNKILSENVLMTVAMTFVVLFPVWFHRYARSLWLGFDQWIDPRPPEEKREAN